MEHFQYGTTTISYELNYTKRKTLGINVYPDTTVEVIAPLDADKEIIEEKLLKRAKWIVKQINYFKGLAHNPIIKEYVSGETHYYLGRAYRLKVTEAKEQNVKLIGRFFHIQTPTQHREQIKKLLTNWYRKQAVRKFKERLDICYKQMLREEIKYPDLEIRQMAKRWGSCTANGKIILNLALIKTPTYCIDYVIIHELCHLKHHNHSPDFYQLKTKYMPDWEERKKRLEQQV